MVYQECLIIPRSNLRVKSGFLSELGFIYVENVTDCVS